MCICMFNGWELTTWTFWSGGCLWGHAAPFELQLHSQQSGHPQVGNGWLAPEKLDAWLNAWYGPPFHRALILGRRGAGGIRMPLVALLIWASVCCVWAEVAQISHCCQHKEATLVWVLQALLSSTPFFMLNVYVDVGVSEASLLTGAERFFVLECWSQAGRLASAFPIGWLSSISMKHSEHSVRSEFADAPAMIIISVYVFVKVWQTQILNPFFLHLDGWMRFFWPALQLQFQSCSFSVR